MPVGLYIFPLPLGLIFYLFFFLYPRNVSVLSTGKNILVCFLIFKIVCSHCLIILWVTWVYQTVGCNRYELFHVFEVQEISLIFLAQDLLSDPNSNCWGKGSSFSLFPPWVLPDPQDLLSLGGWGKRPRSLIYLVTREDAPCPSGHRPPHGWWAL